jgi:hypothetical protein
MIALRYAAVELRGKIGAENAPLLARPSLRAPRRGGFNGA